MNSTDIATYLIQHPHFFEEHAELLGSIKLTSPIMGRAISLQERQMEVVREKYRSLELRMADLLRIAEENHDISQKFQRWTRAAKSWQENLDASMWVEADLGTLLGLHDFYLYANPSVTWGTGEEWAWTVRF